tara:strand:+ start:6206 stop:7276 length:1071 start_codon:yes stop_codon:yes gene_type:complete
MGPGFGGINIGGFALPEINMEEVNAGIAAQLAPEIAKYLAEQNLSTATNEFEKDVAENTIDQITDYETGIGTLPPVVEEILEEIRQPREDVVYARDDRPIRSYSPSYFSGEDERAIGRENEGIASIATPAPIPTPVPAPMPVPVPAPAPIVETVNQNMGIQNLPTNTEADLKEFYNPSYMGFEDERAIGREDLRNLGVDLSVLPTVSPVSIEKMPAPAITPSIAPVADIVGGYTDIQTMPDNTGMFIRQLPPPSPISNLIRQQRQAYNSALQNAVYNPQTSQPRSMYIRPMSAAEFGSRPGEELTTNQPTNLLAMQRGGAMKLPNSPMNMGLGGLPPMQQNDKLTQLFAQSFNPRR